MGMGEGSVFRSGMNRRAKLRGIVGIAEGAFGQWEKQKEQQRKKALDNIMWGGEEMDVPDPKKPGALMRRQSVPSRLAPPIIEAGGQMGFDPQSGKHYVQEWGKPRWQQTNEALTERAKMANSGKERMHANLMAARAKTPEELEKLLTEATKMEYTAMFGGVLDELEEGPIKQKRYAIARRNVEQRVARLKDPKAQADWERQLLSLDSQSMGGGSLVDPATGEISDDQISEILRQ